MWLLTWLMRVTASEVVWGTPALTEGFEEPRFLDFDIIVVRIQRLLGPYVLDR